MVVLVLELVGAVVVLELVVLVLVCAVVGVAAAVEMFELVVLEFVTVGGCSGGSGVCVGVGGAGDGG